jgi:hypothetical protein
MAEKIKRVITGPIIKIKGNLPRHQIVKKVVNTFIETEGHQNRIDVTFKYPVEILPDNQYLYISRPGYKSANGSGFDFMVEVVKNYKIGKGRHKDIGEDLIKKGMKVLMLSRFLGKPWHRSTAAWKMM